MTYFELTDSQTTEKTILVGSTILKQIELSEEIAASVSAELSEWQLVKQTEGKEILFWHDNDVVDHSSTAIVSMNYIVVKDEHFYGVIFNTEDVHSAGMGVSFDKQCGVLFVDGTKDGKTEACERHSGSEVEWEHNVTYKLEKI